MRLKLDENLSRGIADFLKARGHDVDTVADEGLAGSTDRVVSHVCQDAERMLVTLDHDFADIREYPPGEHPGIIVIRLAIPRPRLVEAALVSLLDKYDLSDLGKCTVIVQLGGIRIRRPNG